MTKVMRDGQDTSQARERVNEGRKGYVMDVYTVAQKGNRCGDSRQSEINVFRLRTMGPRVRAGRFVSSGSRPRQVLIPNFSLQPGMLTSLIPLPLAQTSLWGPGI